MPHEDARRALVQVLRSFTGSDYSGLNATVPPGASLVEPGFVPAAPVSLSWQTFRQMAVEAGASRCHARALHPLQPSALQVTHDPDRSVRCLNPADCASALCSSPALPYAPTPVAMPY